MSSNPMRQWGHAPSETELEALRSAAGAFGELWASIRSPFPAEFNGTKDDVLALHYLAYEGVGDPQCGLEGAALICGEVLRRAAGLEWVIDHTGLRFIASGEDDWPRVAICPLVRLRELEYAATPQFGRYLRFLSRAASDCLSSAGPERASSLRELIAEDEDFVPGLERVIDEVSEPGSSAYRTAAVDRPPSRPVS